MNAVPVAEYTLATILLGLKNHWFHAFEIKRLRRLTERVHCAGAYGSKVGLISLGMIGRLVRERLRAFDVEVLAHDPYIDPAEAGRLGVTLVPLDEIFSQCDALTVAGTPYPAGSYSTTDLGFAGTGTVTVAP